MSATQELAQYAADLRYEDLPAEIVDKTRVLIRDSLGCLLAGGTLESASQVRRMIMPMAAAGP